MRYLTQKRRHFAAVLVLATILSLFSMGTSSAGSNSDKTLIARRSSIPARICDFDWRKSTWQVKQLIKCSARHWDVPGGAVKALSIAYRESRYDPDAYNPSGALGIYQHMRSYWPGRARKYGFPRWSAFNARANIIVTMRMVKAGGWGPWGG